MTTKVITCSGVYARRAIAEEFAAEFSGTLMG
jgi:hypothetical protein